MLVLKIRRFVPENPIVTYGVYLKDNNPFALTLEPSKKRIPVGEYSCVRYSSKKYPDVWEIIVPNRTLILQHWGNFLKDTEGCILIGEKFIDLNLDGITDIGQSRSEPNNGFSELMAITKGLTEYKLIIEQAFIWLNSGLKQN